MTDDKRDRHLLNRTRVLRVGLGFFVLLVGSILGWLFIFETSSSSMVRTAGPIVALIAIPLFSWGVGGYVRGLAVGFAEIHSDGFSYPLTLASRTVPWHRVRDVRLDGEFILVVLRSGLRRRINTAVLDDPQRFVVGFLEAWRNYHSS